MDQVDHKLLLQLEDFGGVGFEGVEVIASTDNGMFDGFSETATQFARRQGGESFDIGPDQAGLVKGADHIFAPGMIDTGFTTYAAIDHGQEGGGYLDVGDTAFEGGSDEPGEIAYDTSAQSDNGIGSVQCEIKHFIVKGFDDTNVLAGFAGSDDAQVGFNASG
jgi:hypothetical protein